MSTAIDRIVFNFSDRCEMGCPFCYVPFDYKQSSFDHWCRIIDQCEKMKAGSVTFSGSEPFAKKDFVHLLAYAKEKNFFVQVDTNGSYLNGKGIEAVEKFVDLIGFPIDGTRDVHMKMRRLPHHFEHVMNLVECMTGGQTRVKINTVVTGLNAGDICGLADLLTRYKLYGWSVYQFWPIGPAAEFRSLYEIEEDAFNKVRHALLKKYGNRLNIQASSISDRAGGYFFVRSSGSVYAIDGKDSCRYVELGSIFDEDILEKWKAHGKTQKVNERAEQYRGQGACPPCPIKKG